MKDFTAKIVSKMMNLGISRYFANQSLYDRLVHVFVTRISGVLPKIDHVSNELRNLITKLLVSLWIPTEKDAEFDLNSHKKVFLNAIVRKISVASPLDSVFIFNFLHSEDLGLENLSDPANQFIINEMMQKIFHHVSVIRNNDNLFGVLLSANVDIKPKRHNFVSLILGILSKINVNRTQESVIFNIYCVLLKLCIFGGFDVSCTSDGQSDKLDGTGASLSACDDRTIKSLLEMIKKMSILNTKGFYDALEMLLLNDELSNSIWIAKRTIGEEPTIVNPEHSQLIFEKWIQVFYQDIIFRGFLFLI
jgi:hypothetical protein